MTGIRFSVCSELFKLVNGLDFYETIIVIKRLDADVELAPFTEKKPVTEINLGERIKRKQFLDDNGVRVSGLHWILAGGGDVFKGNWEIPGGPSITSSNLETRQRTADYAIEVFKYVSRLRGFTSSTFENPLVAVWGSPQQRNLFEVSYKEGVRNSAEVFARIIRSGGHLVTIALERLVNSRLINGETNFCYNMEQVNDVVSETRRLLEDIIPSEYIRSMLDTKAAVLSFEDPLQVLDNPNIIYHVHVQDPYSLGPPGWDSDGNFRTAKSYNFEPLLTELERINEIGEYVCVSMEPFKPFFDNPQVVEKGITPEVAFRESLQYMRDVVKD